MHMKVNMRRYMRGRMYTMTCTQTSRGIGTQVHKQTWVFAQLCRSAPARIHQITTPHRIEERALTCNKPIQARRDETEIDEHVSTGELTMQCGGTAHARNLF